MDERRKKQIEEGRTALGIELGSTRIKAVLVGEDNVPLAAGSHEWENRLENGHIRWMISGGDCGTAIKNWRRRYIPDMALSCGKQAPWDFPP